VQTAGTAFFRELLRAARSTPPCWTRIQEIEVRGDWAYLRNYIEMTVWPPDGGKPVRRSGYTLTLLRQERDGRWRLARDANLPAAEQ
jgi:uncharacterized protein (TIGR02246 family)